MHAHLCLALLVFASLGQSYHLKSHPSNLAAAVSSPLPEPEPAPIDPALAAIIASNLNLACMHGCRGAPSVHQHVSRPFHKCVHVLIHELL